MTVSALDSSTRRDPPNKHWHGRLGITETRLLYPVTQMRRTRAALTARTPSWHFVVPATTTTVSAIASTEMAK